GENDGGAVAGDPVGVGTDYQPAIAQTSGLHGGKVGYDETNAQNADRGRNLAAVEIPRRSFHRVHLEMSSAPDREHLGQLPVGGRQRGAGDVLNDAAVILIQNHALQIFLAATGGHLKIISRLFRSRELQRRLAFVIGYGGRRAQGSSSRQPSVVIAFL